MRECGLTIELISWRGQARARARPSARSAPQRVCIQLRLSPQEIRGLDKRASTCRILPQRAILQCKSLRCASVIRDKPSQNSRRGSTSPRRLSARNRKRTSRSTPRRAIQRRLEKVHSISSYRNPSLIFSPNSCHYSHRHNRPLIAVIVIREFSRLGPLFSNPSTLTTE